MRTKRFRGWQWIAPDAARRLRYQWITSKPGFRLVRVKAKVLNIWPHKERPYARFAFSAIENIMMQDDLPEGPFRWLDDQFVFVLTPTRDLIPCCHIAEGCALRGNSMTITKPGEAPRMIFPPKAVKNGDSVGIEMIFSVPSGVSGLKLLVAGAAPVPIPDR